LEFLLITLRTSQAVMKSLQSNLIQ